MTARSAPPLSWELSPPERTPGLGAVLRLGARALPVREICGFIGSSDLEIDRKPAYATLAVFGVAAMFFVLGVVDIGWRTRFLVAAGLFGLIALSALHDMAWMTMSGLFRVEILTVSGETLCYTTIDPLEQERLMLALEKVVARPQAANDDCPIDVVPPPRAYAPGRPAFPSRANLI